MQAVLSMAANSCNMTHVICIVHDTQDYNGAHIGTISEYDAYKIANSTPNGTLVACQIMGNVIHCITCCFGVLLLSIKGDQPRRAIYFWPCDIGLLLQRPCFIVLIPALYHVNILDTTLFGGGGMIYCL